MACPYVSAATLIFIASGGPQAHGNSLENDVIPAKAGIHSVPDQQWPPAFAGVTAPVIFIPLGGSKTHDHLE
jgi:hypothetical protein